MKSRQQEESSKDLVAEDGGGSSSGGGTSRFYECTFCKQGFTTAQALGGHMNIHRRERARIRQPIVPSSSIPIQQPHGHEKHTRPDFPWSISGSFPQAQDYHHHHMYLPSPTSSSSNPSRHPYPSVHVDNSQTRSPCSMRLFEEDQSTNLSLRIGYPEEVKNQFGAEEEVDLELRLGHDP